MFAALLVADVVLLDTLWSAQWLWPEKAPLSISGEGVQPVIPAEQMVVEEVPGVQVITHSV